MLPQAFLKRMQSQLGPDFPAYLASLDRPRAVALRLNPAKIPPTALSFLKDPVPWEPSGYYYDSNARPGLHPYHEAGVYYLQEASAMAPVALLDPQPGEWVCDLCAAPGGKSTQIAGRMGGSGILLSNEIHPQRAKILSRNIERLGISNALVTNETPAALACRFPGQFDRVLVDAPCSGEGMFRKEEAAVTDWSQETVAMCAKRQTEILSHAAKMVRPGGRLVYSTCTFAPEENERIVEHFLQQHPDFEPDPIDAPWFSCSGPGMYRLWPHKLLGEGHFAAVLRRHAGPSIEHLGSTPADILPSLWTEFASSLGITLPAGKALRFGSSLFWVPEDLFQLSGLKVLRPGLELGTQKPNRLEPAHALALWLSGCVCEVQLPSLGPEMLAYLHGDVLPCKTRGWCLVKADDYPIGWGKGDGSILKNHYPKGLRR